MTCTHMDRSSAPCNSKKTKNNKISLFGRHCNCVQVWSNYFIHFTVATLSWRFVPTFPGFQHQPGNTVIRICSWKNIWYLLHQHRVIMCDDNGFRPLHVVWGRNTLIMPRDHLVAMPRLHQVKKFQPSYDDVSYRLICFGEGTQKPNHHPIIVYCNLCAEMSLPAEHAGSDERPVPANLAQWSRSVPLPAEGQGKQAAD